MNIDIEIEKREILNKYKSLLRVCSDKTDKEDKKIIRKAFNLAVDAHKDMRRKSGEPYIYHPIAVAHIAAKEIGLGTTSIVCALLHDVVEDTDYEIEDMERIFGKKVARIVNEFLKINCSFKDAKNELKKFEIKNNLNLKLKNFDIFNLKFKNKDTIFSTNIGRNAEYYTGLVFEIYKKSKNLNLASGGRYDNLMQTLGSNTKVPAIGGAINYDNLLKL